MSAFNTNRRAWLPCLSLLLLSGAVSVGLGQTVVIDEIMYQPASGRLRESYVELFNPGNAPVNLSGWKFSKGFQYTFPANTALAAKDYLVVAADGTAFSGKYPGVTNYVAGWTAPMTTHVVLSDAGGNTISDVNFSRDGDWAVRLLTTNYPNAYGQLSWEWLASHDGLGSSLELMNPALPEEYALNWNSSSVPDGTPGWPNSVAQTNIAPIIYGVIHAPAIPRPTDVVTISTHLLDERTNGLAVTLYYRNASTATPPAFSSQPMADDGAHNDRLANDGIYAAILPPQPNDAVVEFYLQATDLEGHVRRYPEVITPTNSTRTANLLYQVADNSPAGAQPLYRLVLTETERRQLYLNGRGCPESDSDANMNGTFISTDGIVDAGTTTQVRYNISIRNRGHGSRTANPNNYHLDLPHDRAWKNVTGINLNSQYAYSQVLGSAVFRRLGIPMAESRLVQVEVNGTNLMSLPGLPNNNSFGSYAANEQYNQDFITRAFPLDSAGNSYRGIREQATCDPIFNASVADLTWHGPDFAQAAYTNAYFKQNNEAQNDWSDLLDLLAVLNSTNGHAPENYVADVRQRLDVEQWMRHMAVNTLLDNNETVLANGVGDDYALYRGVADPRFLLLPYDNDTLMGRGLTAVSPHHGLFRMTALPVLDRFMKTPEFAPVYFRWLRDYAANAFAPAEMNPLLDQLFKEQLPANILANLKAFNAAQVSWVLSQIPQALTVGTGLLVQNGYPRTTNAALNLNGTANAIETRTVLINGAPAQWVAWQGTWSAANVPLTPGINRLLVQSVDASGAEFASTNVDVWYDDGTVQSASGTITSNTTWTAAGGPYHLTASLTVPNGVTLTIQPGTTVYLGAGVNFTVANGGRLLAEGTLAAPIRFTTMPGAGTSWGGVIINGAVGSPESRIAYATFEGNSATCLEVAGGTLALDHTTFLTTTRQYLALDGASFLVSHCYFPSATSTFELVHGTGGIKAGGRGIIRDCFFGGTIGYNDVVDFTGGNRDLGQPIIQFYNNVFSAGTDDGLDLDGTDAWIEGNIFLHFHRNGSPDSASAISGGNNDFGGAGGVRTSELTIIGNLFYDCDQAATAKQGNFFTLLNNTFVRTTKTGGQDFAAGVVNVRDTVPDITPFAAGFYLEGNIILDAEQLVRNYDAAQTTVTLSNNILPYAWNGPGGGNVVADPLLMRVPAMAETYFTNWIQAQVMRDWFALLPGSPAWGTGPNGQNRGGVIPLGASLSGVPAGTNNQTTAVLTVGPVRSGSGIPVAGWPGGAGYTHFQWQLDAGAWSAETSIQTPITLSGLANGPHTVSVIGKRDSGLYQNDPALGPDALVTTSPVWVVDTSYVPPVRPTIRLNELLAANATTLTNGGTTPDVVELFNYGTAPVSLVGLGLTTSSNTPYKYIFPAGTPLLNPGQYLVVFADSQNAAPGIHLGFALSANGEGLRLYDTVANGGGVLDAVTFGPQVPDLSIGRGVDGTWNLCQPTFGAANRVLPLGDSHAVKINEWLADELFLANNDFIELFNPGPRPVALGGHYLSNAEGAKDLNPLAPLSFLGAAGHFSFVADGDPQQGAHHLNFALSPEVGEIILSDPALNTIDVVNYGPQVADVSQGRSPSGSETFAPFPQPTAGGPNSSPNGGTVSVTNISSLVVKLLELTNTWRFDNSGVNQGTAWSAIAFNDSSWASGQALFGFETTPAQYPYAFNTVVPAPNQANGHITVYYRAHFSWNGSLTNVSLVSANFVDDGAVYYLNGTKVGSLRMPASFSYTTAASDQANEGAPEVLVFPANSLVTGDNVLAVEVHQTSTGSSDDVFGLQLNAVQFTTNILTTTTVGVPVVLNEILASNDTVTNGLGATSDWIELYNLSTNAVSVADLSLSDDPQAARKFVFAAGTSIPPNGFLLVECNDLRPASATNTGFALKATGESVFLFNSLTNGGGLIDAVTFGLQVTDYSLGRVPTGQGGWTLNLPTPGAVNESAVLDTAAGLRINEWMAANPDGPDWFEVANLGEHPVSLSGLYLTRDLNLPTQSPLAPLSFIGAGAHGYIQFIADKNPGADHVNFKLTKSGVSLGLFGASTMIDAITFGPQATAISEGRFPDGAAARVFFSQPTPAAGNFLSVPGLYVNELMPQNYTPWEAAVEFYNETGSTVDVSGWFLSDSLDDLKKYRLANNTVIAPSGFKVFYEHQFNPTNGSSTPFTFDRVHGGEVYLSQADTLGNLSGYRVTASFGPAFADTSFGRYRTSIGVVNFVGLNSPNFGVAYPATLAAFRLGTGATNGYPLVGPVVINEIMFRPPSADGIEDNDQDEYLELQNPTGLVVPLFDPAAPTNTWQLAGGIDFTFPPGVTLAPGQFILLVNFNPEVDLPALAEFRTRYGVSNTVPLFGPYSGHLANGGENIALYRPAPPQIAPAPDAGFVPRVLVEKVNYGASAPWPGGASATGNSLQRNITLGYGNDPINWFVAAPTAALPNTANPTDRNNDGLDDGWQLQYFGALADPRATLHADPDGDGVDNHDEYLAGTSPVDANDFLHLDAAVESGDGLHLEFTAVAGHTYSVVWRPAVGGAVWQKLADIPAPTTTGRQMVVDPETDGPSRFYRLITPASVD